MHNNIHIKTIIYIYYYSTAKKTKKVENATYYTILRFQPYYIYLTQKGLTLYISNPEKVRHSVSAYRITR